MLCRGPPERAGVGTWKPLKIRSVKNVNGAREGVGTVTLGDSTGVAVSQLAVRDGDG